MRAAGRSGTEDCPVQMKLVAPPLYVLTTQTLDKAKGIQVLNDAIEVAEQTIKSHKGNFKVKEAPRTVSERDDLLLQSKVCIFICTLALHSHSMQLSLYICQLERPVEHFEAHTRRTGVQTFYVYICCLFA